MKIVVTLCFPDFKFKFSSFLILSFFLEKKLSISFGSKSEISKDFFSFHNISLNRFLFKTKFRSQSYKKEIMSSKDQIAVDCL